MPRLFAQQRDRDLILGSAPAVTRWQACGRNPDEYRLGRLGFAPGLVAVLAAQAASAQQVRTPDPRAAHR